MTKHIKISTILMFLLIISLFISCKKNSRCFHKRGETISRAFTFEPFSKVQINDLFDVYWHFDSQYRIEIETGKNMQTFIEAKLENGCLAIKDNNRCNWLRKYERTRIHIYCPTLTEMEIWGSGDYYFIDTLSSDSFKISNWADITKMDIKVNCRWFAYSQNAGTGDTYISGKAGISYLWVSGMGYLYAQSLKSDYTYITNRTTGNCYAYANKEAGAYIYKSGNIFLYGNPPVILQKYYGIGKLYIVQ